VSISYVEKQSARSTVHDPEAAASDYRPAARTTKRRDENPQNQQLPLDINDGPFPMPPPTNCFKLLCCRLEVLKWDLKNGGHPVMLNDRPLARNMITSNEVSSSAVSGNPSQGCSRNVNRPGNYRCSRCHVVHLYQRIPSRVVGIRISLH
jgi:hypothetical protein